LAEPTSAAVRALSSTETTTADSTLDVLTQAAVVDPRTGKSCPALDIQALLEATTTASSSSASVASSSIASSPPFFALLTNRFAAAAATLSLLSKANTKKKAITATAAAATKSHKKYTKAVVIVLPQLGDLDSFEAALTKVLDATCKYGSIAFL
jgi:hypothetical protein